MTTVEHRLDFGHKVLKGEIWGAIESILEKVGQVITVHVPSNLLYKWHQIPKLKCVLPRLASAFAQSIEARCCVENEDVVGAAPTGDAPTTSEWSSILLTTKVHLILEIRQYFTVPFMFFYDCLFAWSLKQLGWTDSATRLLDTL